MSGSVKNGAKITDPKVEKLLTGLYKSNNVNLYDFRRPTGILTSTNPFTEVLENTNQYSNLLHSGQALTNDLNIVKPNEFTTFKGHVIDHERALQSQKRFQKEYIVQSGSSYFRGSPILNYGGRHLDVVKDCGSGFRTSFKAQDEVSRVLKRHADNPVMAKSPSN